MVFKTTPLAGPDLNIIIPANQSWYDQAGRGSDGTSQVVTPQTGLVVAGSDAREYILVRASAAIASAASPGTQLALTKTVSADGVTTVTAAAGSGGFYPAVVATAIPIGATFWAAKGTATI